MAVGLLAPLALCAALVPVRGSFPHTDAALALILVVVTIAAAGRRFAGLAAAVSAAAWFDFFLTMPYERFAIARRGDLETTVLLLAIGAAVTEIAVRGRRYHEAAARRAGYLDGIGAAARAVAAGESPSALTEQVAGQLTRLLSLSACRFQHGVAGIGGPARLRRDGQVILAGRVMDPDRDDLAGGMKVEVLAEAAGLLQGRFLLTLAPGARRRREEWLVAIALADQVGAALAQGRLAGGRA